MRRWKKLREVEKMAKVKFVIVVEDERAIECLVRALRHLMRRKGPIEIEISTVEEGEE